MDKIARIYQELDKRYQEYRAKMKTEDFTYYEGMADALDLFEQFLDTLSKEPDRSLEEEVKNYFQGYWPGTETVEQCNTDLHFTPPAIIRLARHFAEWQYQKDRKEFAKIKAKTWCEGFDAHKSQMMKEAVEGEICGRVYDHINVRFADGVCKYLEPKNISHIPADVSKYNIGDKVKVIVLRDESK